MRKLLIVGDSLAGGPPHLSYPKIAAAELSGFMARTISLPGRTLKRIGEALAAALPLHRPELVVFQGGGNDLLLPYLEKRGGRWRILVRLLKRRGNQPASDIEEFGLLFREAVRPAVVFPVEILVLSIPCLGEDLRTSLNEKRRMYNEVLESETQKLGIRLVRIDEAQEEFIRERKKASPYLMDRFSGFFLDAFRSLTPGSALRLSESRGLHLTLDGVHPNPLGARLIADLLVGALGDIGLGDEPNNSHRRLGA